MTRRPATLAAMHLRLAAPGNGRLGAVLSAFGNPWILQAEILGLDGTSAHERLENQARVEAELPKFARRLETVLPASVAERAGMFLGGGESHDEGEWGTHDRWIVDFRDPSVSDGRRMSATVRAADFDARLVLFSKTAAEIVRLLPPIPPDAPIWRAIFADDQTRGEMDVRAWSADEASERASALRLLRDVLDQAPHWDPFIETPQLCVLREHLHPGAPSSRLKAVFDGVGRG